VMFPTLKAVECCLRRQEIVIKKLRLRFEPVNRPYRLVGREVHKGRYDPFPPVRPLEIVPAPCTFRPPNY